MGNNAPAKVIANKIDHSKLDLSSETYHEVKRYVEVRINQLRLDNDAKADAENTAYTRGKIAEMKSFLDKCEPKVMKVK